MRKKSSSSCFFFLSWRWRNSCEMLFDVEKFFASTSLLARCCCCVTWVYINFPQCLNLVRADNNNKSTHTCIVYIKNAYLWWQSLFFPPSRLSFVRSTLYEMCYYYYVCTFHIKKASELERCEGWWQAIEKGINKKSFLFAKYFHIQTSTKKKWGKAWKNVAFSYALKVLRVRNS